MLVIAMSFYVVDFCSAMTEHCKMKMRCKHCMNCRLQCSAIFKIQATFGHEMRARFSLSAIVREVNIPIRTRSFGQTTQTSCKIPRLASKEVFR